MAASTCCATDWIVDSKLEDIDSGVRSNLGRGEVAQPIPPKSETPINTSKSLLRQRGMSLLRRNILSGSVLGANTGGRNGGALAFNSGGFNSGGTGF